MNAKTKTKRKAKQIRRLNKKLLKSEDKYNIFNPSCEIDIEYILGIKEPPMVVNIPMTPNNIPKYKPRLKVPNHEDIIGIDFNCGSHFIVCSNNKIYKYSELIFPSHIFKSFCSVSKIFRFFGNFPYCV